VKTLTFPATQEVILFGRDPRCDVHLESEIVSRRHAEVRRNDALYALLDLGTANGTFVNGRKVDGLTLLNDGDGIAIGKFRIRFSAQTAADSFQALSADVEGDSVDLGGMTLRMAPESAKRVAGDQNRVRGEVVLRRTDGGTLRHVVSETFQVGKDPSCDLVIKGWFSPRKALVISRGQDRYTLINVGSAEKVLLDGRPVGDRAKLEGKHRVEVYGQTFLFEVQQPDD
jgi:pSer/pThr/pTyr-binding forkhead associated (FHA) protein